MHKLVEVFCDVDDFCAVFIPEWEKTLLTDGTRKRQRAGRMTMSEVMTIILLFPIYSAIPAFLRRCPLL